MNAELKKSFVLWFGYLCYCAVYSEKTSIRVVKHTSGFPSSQMFKYPVHLVFNFQIIVPWAVLFPQPPIRLPSLLRVHSITLMNTLGVPVCFWKTSRQCPHRDIEPVCPSAPGSLSVMVTLGSALHRIILCPPPRVKGPCPLGQ